MPSKDGYKRSPIVPTQFFDSEFFARNPFAEEPEFFTSALPATPIYRRRGSDGASRRDPWREKHLRAASENQSGQTWHDPLNGNGASGSDDAGVTRPYLSRVVGVLDSASASPSEEREHALGEFGSKKMRVDKNKEETVLVHMVTPQDSLAGIALKYGISMAELRKANHLWASDSIHLRKILYIPLAKAKSTHARICTVDRVGDFSSSSLSPPSETSYLGGNTIRRVPASQLSFFPPPSKSNSSSRRTSEDTLTPYPSSERSLSRPSGTSSWALSSILSAFPLSTATRETIVSRLSMDSRSSSASDDHDHELSRVHQRFFTDPTITPGSRNRKMSQSSQLGGESSAKPLPTVRTSLSRPRDSESTGTRATGGGVRTSQLQPSLGMQLPVTPSRNRPAPP